MAAVQLKSRYYISYPVINVFVTKGILIKNKPFRQRYITRKYIRLLITYRVPDSLILLHGMRDTRALQITYIDFHRVINPADATGHAKPLSSL